MEYPLLLFEIDNTNQTSVNTEKYEQKKQYNENFKKFIAPRLKSDEAMKIKKFGGKMKSYAQALGIPIQANNKESQKETNNTNKKNLEKKEKDDITQKYQKEIKELKKQISGLTSLLKDICTTMIYDNEMK